jgi:nucleotide-binding universal stress UspA family protein
VPGRTIVALLDGSPLDEAVVRRAQRLVGSGRIVLYRGAADSLLNQSWLGSADMLVVGLPGKRGFGATAESPIERVIASSPLPVFVARVVGGRPLGDRPNILVPLDGSAFAEKALPVAANLAVELGGELTILQAVPLAGSFPPPGAAAWDVCALDILQSDALAYLNEVTKEYSLQHAKVLVRVGQAARAIVDAANAPSLVVMATHVHPRWRRMLVGSVTDQVLRYTAGPVVLVRGRAPSGTASGADQHPSIHHRQWPDERALNGLLFARHIINRLYREEFLSTSGEVAQPAGADLSSRDAATVIHSRASTATTITSSSNLEK